MGTPNKIGLSKLAFQNSRARRAISSVRCFYQNQTMGATASTLRMEQPQEWQGQKNTWDEGHDSTNKLSKVFDLKKNLINQMQGMMKQMRPRAKSQPPTLGSGVQELPASSKHRPYGQTKLFSPVSNANFFPAGQNRSLSYSTSHSMSANSVSEQRYMYDKRTGDLARDISKSIQSELMEVNSATKRLISCAHKLEQAKSAEEEEERGHHQRHPHHHHPHHHHHLPQASQQEPMMRLEELGNWSMRPVRPTEQAAKEENLIKQQRKPLRRKFTNIRVKDELSESIGHVQPSMSSRRLQAQLGDLYATSNKLRSLKNRTDRRVPFYPSMFVSEPVSYQRNRKTSGQDIEEQRGESNPKTETRDTATTFSSAHAAPSLALNGRMDELHYQSKMGTDLLSASQRVITKRFEDIRKESGDVHRVKKPKNTESTKSLKQPMPKVKLGQPDITKSGKFKSKLNNKSSKSASSMSTSKIPKLMPRNSQTMPEANASDSNDKMEMARKLDMTMSNYANPVWKMGRPQPSIKAKKSASVPPRDPPREPQVQIGEMRGAAKQETGESMSNDVPMPNEYTKQSAVQRLGIIFDKRPHQSFFSSLH